MRSKEEANDYRYFPCPDLLPVVLSEETLARLRSALPELPDARIARLAEQFALSGYDAAQIGGDRATSDYFERVAASADAKLAANWINGELSAQLNSAELTIEQSPIAAEQLAALLQRISDNTLSSKMAREVFNALWQGERDVDAIIDQRGLRQVSDSGALSAMVAAVLADNSAMVADYLGTPAEKRKKKLGGFMGKIMQASKGQANPQQVNQILLEQLQALEG